MLIGIGGCSRSGKSTLAADLTWHFRCQNFKVIALSQDDFVHKIKEIPLINNQTDWDTPLSIDYELLIETCQFLQQKFDVVIVEGLYAFYYSALNALFDRSIMVEISESTFRLRRHTETRWGAEPEWFIDHVWASYLKFGKPSFNKNLLTVSGESPFVLEEIITYFS